MAIFSRRTLLLLLLRKRLQRKKYRKRTWVRKIYKERKTKGEFHLLVKEMKVCDHELFFKYFRMNPTQYENLFKLIAPAITKSSIKREVIGPSERLSVILRYLSTGDVVREQ